MEDAVQITNKGMTFLNEHMTRKVLLEKTKKLNEVDVIFEEIYSKMLVILEGLKDGKKKLRITFDNGQFSSTEVIHIMMTYDFIRYVESS